MLKADVETDEEVLMAVDRLGEDYGAIISYILGFDKKFEDGETHKHLKSTHNGALTGLFKKFF